MQSYFGRLLCLIPLFLVVTACSSGMPSPQGAAPSQDNADSVSGGTASENRGASGQGNPSSGSGGVSGTYVSTGSNGVAVLRLVDTRTNVLGELDFVAVDTLLGQSTTETTQSSNVTGNASNGNIALQVSASDGMSNITMIGSVAGDHLDLTAQGHQLRFVRTDAAGVQNAIAAGARQSQHDAVEKEAAGAVRDATGQLEGLTSDLNDFVKRMAIDPSPYQGFPDWTRDFLQNPNNPQTLYQLSSLLGRRFAEIALLDSRINVAPCHTSHHLPACVPLLAAEKEYATVRSGALAAVEAKRQEWMEYACKSATGTAPSTISLCDKTVQLPIVTAVQYGNPPASAGSSPIEVAGATTSINVTIAGRGAVTIGLQSDSLVGAVQGPGAMKSDVGKQTVSVDGTASITFNVALPAVGADGTPRAPYVELPIFLAYRILPSPEAGESGSIGTVFVRENVLNPAPTSR